MTTESPAEFCERVGKLCEAATPGPWTAFTTSDSGAFHVSRLGESYGNVRGVCHLPPEPEWFPEKMKEPTKDNAEFIADARTSLPRALSIIRQQEAELAALREWKAKAMAAMTIADDLLSEYGDECFDLAAALSRGEHIPQDTKGNAT